MTAPNADSRLAAGAVSLPRWHGDYFADDILRQPYDTYRQIRDLGPAVLLSQHGVVAIARYHDVRAALADAEAFCSGQGVALNDVMNEPGAGSSVLMTDGEHHDVLRRALANRLTPRALRSMQVAIQDAADNLVDELVEQKTFDAVSDLAVALPLSVVPDLIGWPVDAREHLLSWAAASFEMMGPLNSRAQAAMPRFAAMLDFTQQIVDSGDVLAGSLAEDLLAAAHRGEIPLDRCAVSMVDYLAPSLDTTISAISAAVHLFAQHPEQWDLVRADPALIPSAFDEAIRLTTPVKQFARVTTRPVDIDTVRVPADTRVLLMFASANRDERHWDRADTFDVRRPPGAMLGFGYGVHNCAGQGLARLEGHALLKALSARVARFNAGQAIPTLSNTIQGLSSLPVSIEPASTAQVSPCG